LGSTWAAERLEGVEMRRQNKYHATAVVADGQKFASKREYQRFRSLQLLQLAGEISGLQRQPHFDFSVVGPDGVSRKIGRGYTADFAYCDRAGCVIVEEVKGMAARDWPLRRDLFLALYPGLVLKVNGKEQKPKTARNRFRATISERTSRDRRKQKGICNNGQELVTT